MRPKRFANLAASFTGLHSDIPDINDSLRSPRQKVLAVGCEGHAIHAVLRAFELPELFLRAQVPQNNRAALAGRGEDFTVLGKGQCADAADRAPLEAEALGSLGIDMAGKV